MDTIESIRGRTYTTSFDPEQSVDDAELRALITLACHAPSAFNTQPWRFVTLRTSEERRLASSAAADRSELLDAPVVILVCGDLRAHEQLGATLDNSVQRGRLDARAAAKWLERAHDSSRGARALRDEAVRSSGMAAMCLMLGAHQRGLRTAAVVDFDMPAVREAFSIGARYVPVMLLALGHALPGSEPKPLVRDGLDAVMFDAGKASLPA